MNRRLWLIVSFPVFLIPAAASPAEKPCCADHPLSCGPAAAKSSSGPAPATAAAPAPAGSGGGYRCGAGIAPDPELVRFAVIGDFGHGKYSCEREVSEMIAGWNRAAPLDFIATLGDNNYNEGAASTMQLNVLDDYGDWVGREKFFPSLGNHDWNTTRKAAGYRFGRPYPYLDTFRYLARLAPESEGRYYRIAFKERVELFALDSNYQEPDGTCCNSKQARWLQSALAGSTAPWKLVYFHHPPYSTSKVDFPGVWMRWPFADWCATAVLTGHEHLYERIDKEGFPYIINGLGGNPWVYQLAGCKAEPGSEARYNDAPGAMLVIANRHQLELCFYSTADPSTPLDHYRIDEPRACTPRPGTCTPPPEQAAYCKSQPPRKAPKEPACPAGDFPIRAAKSQ